MIRSSIRAVDAVFRLLLAGLIAVMVLCVTWQVISRYALDAPSQWTEELARFLLIWIGLLGGSFAYHVKMHLGLELLGDRLRGRARLWHGIAVHVCVILFAGSVLIVGGMNLVWLTHELKQHSAALGLPMALVYSSLPISGVMFIVYAGVDIAHRVEVLIGVSTAKDPVEERHNG